jgi:flagellar protein FlaJ
MFDRFDTNITDYTKTKLVRQEDLGKVKYPHPVRLTKGTIPYHEALTGYQKYARIIMAPFVRRYFSNIGEGSKLEVNLMKAHMKFRMEDYLAFVWLTVFVLLGVAFAIAGLWGTITILFKLPTSLAFLIIPLLIAMPVLAYIVLMNLPSSRAKSRGKNIDTKITYAMNFISTLASAEVTVDVIFAELSKQSIYGEIQKEAQWINRDIELLGKDVLTAIRDGATRTPSVKFQDFLQGVVTTTLSGGQLKPYFLMKSEQFARLATLDSKKNQETLGMLAESFVTVVVAMPLFLIVMMSLMALVGKTAGSSILLLDMIVYVMIPVSQLGFIVVIKGMMEEV